MPSVSTNSDFMDSGGLEDHGDPTKVLVRRYLAYLVDFLLITLVAVLALAFTAQANTPEELNTTADDLQVFEEITETRDASGELVDEGTDGSSTTTLYVFYFRDVPVLEDEVGVLVVEPDDLQIVFLAAAAAWVLLYVGLQGFTGATLGKAAAGIRTVKADGEPPGIVRALGRSIFLPIDSLPSAPFLPLIGTIFAVATTGHKRLGDLVGGTYVVDKDARGRPVVVGGDAPVADAAAPAPGPGPAPTEGAPLAAAPVAAGWDQQPAPAAEGAPAAQGAPPPWAAAPAAAPADDLDWTSEQPAPTASADPWAPVAGAGTSASDWEQAIAAEQAEPEPAAASEQTGGGSERPGDGDAGHTIDDYEPQWDEQRRSYIQWDPRRDEWLQYSDELQQWHPIDRPPSG